MISLNDNSTGAGKQVRFNQNGYILFESAFVVAIATGFKSSKNSKTGSMIQVFILPRWIHPKEAVKNGQDNLVCGNCIQRPSVAAPGDAVCYVRVEQAPVSVWHAYKRGSYRHLPSTDLFIGRPVRFGAYGDPTRIPLPLVAEIAGKASRWTGYTHQWRNPLLAGFKRYLMASADDISSQIDATRAGWRTFRVAPTHSTFRLVDEIACPAAKESGHKSSCEKCGLCNGAQKRVKNIVIQSHKNRGKSYRPAVSLAA